MGKDRIKDAEKEVRARRRREAVERNGAHAKTPAPFMNYRGGGDDGKVGLSAAEIARRLRGLAGAWPKRVGQPPQLFVASPDHQPAWLATADELFAWIGRLAPEGEDNAVRWTDGADKVSRSQFAAHLRQTAEHFDGIEPTPHHPPMPRSYYLHPPVGGGDGSALRALLSQFSPAADADYDLIKALFLTLFWGGAPGSRPAFLIEAADEDSKGGRGVGKTALARYAAALAGGHISARPNEPFDKLTTRLLSPAALDRRVVLLDNVKELRFSWADLEAIITEGVISGHGLYVGEARRPNTLTWVITMNGASMSRDLAQRCLPIRLRRPPHNPAWESETLALIESRRWEIIGDIIAELRQAPGELPRYSRWSAWERGVLSHVAEPAECQKVIEERQAAVDDEQAEADLVRHAFVERIVRGGHGDADAAAVWIPVADAAALVNHATGERFPVNKATKYLNALAVRELRRSAKDGKRGWAWRGQASDPTAPLQELGNEPAENTFPG